MPVRLLNRDHRPVERRALYDAKRTSLESGMSTIGQESKYFSFSVRSTESERRWAGRSQRGARMDEGRPGKEWCWGSGSAPLALTLVKQAGHGLGGARIDDWSSVSSKRGCKPGEARARNRRRWCSRGWDAGEQANVGGRSCSRRSLFGEDEVGWAAGSSDAAAYS